MLSVIQRTREERTFILISGIQQQSLGDTLLPIVIIIINLENFLCLQIVNIVISVTLFECIA